MASTATTFAPTAPSTSKASLWAARILSALVILFLLFDAITKIIKEPHVIAASAEFGFTPSTIALIGTILLVCTIFYIIPRTSILGAVLLTGYLGGAVVSQIRVDHSLFECVFPVIFGAVVWGGVYLRNPEGIKRALLLGR